MAIHKIKAKDEKSKTPPKETAKKAVKKVVKKTEKLEQKPDKKPFILFRPFITFGRYIRDSWREIRQVRWPDRKLTWKMTGAVVVYVLIFAAVIMLLDALFAFLFNKLLGV